LLGVAAIVAFALGRRDYRAARSARQMAALEQ
jgi:hypothetical protein